MTLPILLNTNNVTNVTSFASMIKNRLLLYGIINGIIYTVGINISEISESEKL